MEYRQTLHVQRISDNEQSQRDIPSFIEPLPPLISNPFMRPKPVKGTNLLEQFEEDSEYEEPELVQVYLRLKPCNIPSNLYEVRSDQCLVTYLDTATAGHGRRTQHNVSKAYTFTKIFGPDMDQKEIFETVVKDNLRKLADGHSYTLLTYGASGSGKTYTLMGTVQSPGLVPRSLEYVFRVVDAAQQPLCRPSENGAEKLGYAQQEYELQWVKKLRHVSAPLRDKYRRMSAQLQTDFSASTIDLTNRTRYYVWVSFIEIYNEAIYDLLVTSDRRSASKLRIREDASGHVYVKGATQAFVRSGEEAYDVLVAGKHNLQVAATGVHAHSSRSHCIFTITLLTETEAGEMRVSCVRLCDLAGSERQANTRNAGARMAESRAINSSLHVLERCLHMLRRRRRPGTNPGLVPYRESKLTRLLGTGLSGSRGEAVSMVVAVNPDPARAHETRHVLQLAAVARDIQVNNTIAESTLFTLDSDVDTTVAVSAELMKLRSDNERLHFELVQAQSRNEELLCAMEEKQQQAASTMRELVDEAKDFTRQYYEAQVASLEQRHRTEMDDLIEEYELKLQGRGAPAQAGTPSGAAQAVIAQLNKEIAILEERLNGEMLARARAEREVQHLRACIEERDHEKCPEDNENRDVFLLSDEEQSDEDEMNESLEPSFRKEDLNVTSQGRKSCVELHSSIDTDHDTTLDNTAKSASVFQRSSIDSRLESQLEGSHIQHAAKTTCDAEMSSTLEGSSIDIRRDSVETSTKDSTNEQNTCDGLNNTSFNETEDRRSTFSKNTVDIASQSLNNTNGKETTDRRSTFSKNIVDIPSSDCESFKQVIDTKRGTYYIVSTIKESIDSGCSISKINGESKDSVAAEVNLSKDSSCLEENVNISFEFKTVGRVSKMSLDRLKSVDKSVVNGPNESLAMFEQYEKESQCTQKVQKQMSVELISVDILKQKRTYFEEDKSETPKDIVEKEIVTDVVTKKMPYFDMNKTEKSTNHFETESIFSSCKQKKSLFDNFKVEAPKEGPLLKEAPILSERQRKDVKNVNNNPIINADILMENLPDEISNIKMQKEKRTYFDNIGENVDKKVTEVNNSTAKSDDLRWPSIVKDEVPKDYEPTTIKKLLVDSFTSNVPLLAVKSKLTSHIHDSLDIFEEVNSPKLAEPDETAGVENIRKSLNKISMVDIPVTKETEKTSDRIQTLEFIEPLNPLYKSENVTKADNNFAIPRIVTTKVTKLDRTDINEAIDRESEKLENGVKNTTDSTVENSIDAFENIYKDITAPRVTEFELLVTQDDNETVVKEIELASSDRSTAQYNLKQQTKVDKAVNKSKTDANKTNSNEDLSKSGKAYNLRQKNIEPTCSKSTMKSKRSLRLRRQKMVGESQEDDGLNDKLKDIANLREDFADVVSDAAEVKKPTKDIASPEECKDENVAPLTGLERCLSKSVTRSRRKLFTPRAEPLEESITNTGDSNERVCVPRPSYHRGRARRKL